MDLCLCFATWMAAYSSAVSLVKRVCACLVLGHALHKVGFYEKSRLAAAGTADYQNILVPGRLGVFGPVVHGEPFRLRQQNVVVKVGVDVRSNVFGRPP